MAKKRERAGFEPSPVDEKAVTAERLGRCDQVREDELPVRIKCGGERFGKPAEGQLPIQQVKDHVGSLVKQHRRRPWRPSDGLA